MDLTHKKCVPCEGGTPPLQPAEIETYLPQIVPAWQVINNRQIKREFIFKDFAQAIKFVNQVAQLAETEGHHPDIHLIDYKKVIIELTTHAVGGLSENDFIMAAKINKEYRI